MASYIYHGGTEQERDSRVRADFGQVDYLITTVDAEPSLKIGDIRALQASLTATSSRARLILLPHAALLTLPAQHALLKTLEEPPARTTFVLMLPRAALLLPTIRSRCLLVHVPSTRLASSPSSLALVKQALLVKAGARVNLADQLGKDRVGAQEFLSELLTSLHLKIEGSSPKQQLFLAEVARSAYQAHTALQSNVNVTLALREFFLSLPRAVLKYQQLS